MYTFIRMTCTIHFLYIHKEKYMKYSIISLICLLFLTSTCLASKTVIQAPGVNIQSDGSITAPGVQIDPDGKISAPGVTINTDSEQVETANLSNFTITSDNNDQKIPMDKGNLIISGSNNDVKIEGTVVSITITGDNNDIQYPELDNDEVQIINTGSNNDLTKY